MKRILFLIIMVFFGIQLLKNIELLAKNIIDKKLCEDKISMIYCNDIFKDAKCTWTVDIQGQDVCIFTYIGNDLQKHRVYFSGDKLIMCK